MTQLSPADLASFAHPACYLSQPVERGSGTQVVCALSASKALATSPIPVQITPRSNRTPNVFEPREAGAMIRLSSSLGGRGVRSERKARLLKGRKHCYCAACVLLTGTVKWNERGCSVPSGRLIIRRQNEQKTQDRKQVRVAQHVASILTLITVVQIHQHISISPVRTLPCVILVHDASSTSGLLLLIGYCVQQYRTPMNSVHDLHADCCY